MDCISLTLPPTWTVKAVLTRGGLGVATNTPEEEEEEEEEEEGDSIAVGCKR